MTKPTIFVTGATGFIGRHLVQALLALDFEVFAIVRKTGDTRHLTGATVYVGDITDKGSLIATFNDIVKTGITIDYVIHAAGLTKENAGNKFFETNVAGTDNLLKAIKHSGLNPKKIIFLSSLAASGSVALGKTIGIENENPISGYGRSKLAAEPLIKNSGIPYIIIRPTAVFGPGEKDLLTVFKFIARGVNPLLGSRPQELTFIYVDDLVKLIIKATTGKIENQIYFASDGKVYSRQDLTQAISKGVGRKAVNLVVPLPLVKAIALINEKVNSLFRRTSPLNLDKYNELVAESWNCDMARTIRDFEFEAADDLYTGAQKTIDWYKTNKWI